MFSTVTFKVLNIKSKIKEAELSSYLVRQIDSQVDASNFGDFDLNA
ncbi:MULTISPECIES: hypothetical protein [unclassified Pseudoalteromonas]|nr:MULTISPECIES: hypothetical protein [unclassified Pseudoalteromonas]MDN3377830.1 hypothetical protein [Pseudoalteromonas sp. APC 3893]MDN3386026.1 hypothetical protein [Pseudoalteromonas sp. APC 4017]